MLQIYWHSTLLIQKLSYLFLRLRLIGNYSLYSELRSQLLRIMSPFVDHYYLSLKLLLDLLEGRLRLSD